MNKVRVKIQPHGYNNKKVPPPHFFQLWAGLMSWFFFVFFSLLELSYFLPKTFSINQHIFCRWMLGYSPIFHPCLANSSHNFLQSPV
jgi:hypothetical protein